MSVFAVVEGLDGAGKTTLINRLKELLPPTSVFNRDMGGYGVAEDLRKLILTPRTDPMHFKTETLLAYACREENINQLIVPALKAKRIVVSDRFFASTFVYQQLGGAPLDYIEGIHYTTVMNFVPHVTFFLNAPNDVLLSRIKSRGLDGDVTEDRAVANLDRTRELYMQSKKYHGLWIELDATQDPETIAQSALKIILELKEKKDAY